MSDTDPTIPVDVPADDPPPAPEPPPPDPVEEGEAALAKFDKLMATPRFLRLVNGLQHARAALGSDSPAVATLETAVAVLFERS